MSTPSKKADLSFYLGQSQVNAPIEWQDIDILATFDNDSVQANITTDEFTFTNNEAQIIKDWISQGEIGGLGIFEGMPFNIVASNNLSNKNIFSGYLNLSDGLIINNSDKRVKSNIFKQNGLNSLEDRISALSYGYLQSIGVIKQSDFVSIDYVVERKHQFLEIVQVSLMLYALSKEIAEQSKDAYDKTATFFAVLNSSTTSSLSAYVYRALSALISIAYLAALLVAYNAMLNTIFKMVIPPKRTAKGMKLRTAVEKVVNYLGYNLKTNIKDLNNFVYLPTPSALDDLNTDGSIKKAKGFTSGIPNISDYGYSCIEVFSLVQQLFYTKIQIVDNNLYLYNQDDDFWVKQSTYTMPSILEPSYTFNTDEFRANRLVSFQTDVTDEWTIDEFKGTNYEIICNAKATQNAEAKQIKGLDRISIPLALGTRKSKLNAFETVLLAMAKTAEKVTAILGGGSGWSNKVKSRKNCLRVSQFVWGVPKLLYAPSGSLTATHRNNLSAKYIYEKYHTGKSFVANNGYGQKIVYTDIRVPFGFNDFLSLIECSYFKTFDGKTAKATQIKWSLSSDTALISYYIRQPYTKNLKETYIEP